MASMLIVYGSTTGNTGYVAEVIERVANNAGHSAEVVDVSGVDAAGLCTTYDCVLFGCSTWGDDEIEMQDDFIPFFDSFASIGAAGKKVAAFGCGDSSYTFFCGAVDEIEKRLEELGAMVIADSLKIDGDPHAEKDVIEQWATQMIQTL